MKSNTEESDLKEVSDSDLHVGQRDVDKEGFVSKDIDLEIKEYLKTVMTAGRYAFNQNSRRPRRYHLHNDGFHYDKKETKEIKEKNII